MTNKEFFTIAMTLTDNADFIEKAKQNLEVLERKATSKKPTKIQIENEQFKTQVLEIIKTIDKEVTVTEVSKEIGLSINKVSRLMNDMVKDGRLTKRYEKKTALFEAV